MYRFDGAMSIIQEAEDTADEMTVKHSAKSSSLQVMRYDSVVTPLDRLSMEPIPQKLPWLTVSDCGSTMKKLRCGGDPIA